jgi:hypothetical protein
MTFRLKFYFLSYSLLKLSKALRGEVDKQKDKYTSIATLLNVDHDGEV